nr:polyphosphate polymerase domain-containing protein [uncultured Olsenella sp.]
MQFVFKRYELKYRLREDQRGLLEELLEAHAEPDSHGSSTVRNVYYDTPTHLLVRRSEEHPLYKEKLRLRSYAPATDASPVFLELKKKFDGVVYKRRATLPLAAAEATLRGARAPQTQIEREIATTASGYEGLRPAMYLAYEREAFFARGDHDFRVTLDRDVRCRWDDVSLAGSSDGEPLLSPGEILMELKSSRALPLWMVEFLGSQRIFKASFSKYGAAWRLESSRRPLRPRQVPDLVRQADQPLPLGLRADAEACRRLCLSLAPYVID